MQLQLPHNNIRIILHIDISGVYKSSPTPSDDEMITHVTITVQPTRSPGIYTILALFPRVRIPNTMPSAACRGPTGAAGAANLFY